MREELLRKIIQTKIEIGMHVIDELPSSIQGNIKTAIHIFQEELCCSLKQEKRTPKQKQQIQSIHID